MKRFRMGRPSPAMVVAIVALVAAVTGTAYAATKVGTKQLKNKAVTTKKIKNGAVTGAKLAAGAVTGAKLAAGAVSSGNIVDGAVTTSKLTPGERSEGFSKTTLGVGVSLTAKELTVATLNLPPGGHYLVSATTGIGGDGASETAAICSLRDDGTEIAAGGGTAAVSGQLSGSVTLNGVSGGGSVTLVCSQAIAKPTISKNQVITAVRVSSVTQ